MTRSLTAFALALTAALVTPAAQQIQQPVAEPQPQGTAVIRGRVVAADTGQPLRHATIRVVDPAARVNRVASTDAEGGYEIARLPSGRYRVMALQQGYVQRAFTPPASRGGAPTLNLSDGDVVERVDFSLARGAVLSGRVVDETGEAMPGVSVSALRPAASPRPGPLAPRMAQAGQSVTDDLGEFRIYGLDAGTYYLQAVWRGMNIAGLEDRLGYQPTFFPGAPAIAGATPVALQISQQVSGLAFAMIPTRAGRISGTVIDSNGAPVERGFVRAIPLDGGPAVMGTMGPLQPNGAFTMSPVVAGEYLLTVFGSPNDDDFFATPLVATGDDVDNVVVTGVRAVHVTGWIVVDPAASDAPPAGRLTVVVAPASPQILNAAMGRRRPDPAAVAPDLTFDVQGWPVTSDLEFQQLAPSWRVKAIRHRGVDITDEHLPLKPGEDLEGVEVELTDRLTHLTGSAASSSGVTNVEGTLLVFPRDARLRSVVRRTKTAPIRGEGGFSVSGLPPGDYYAVAIETGGQPPAGTADAFDRWEPLATAVTLAEGETRTLDLTFVAPF